MFRAYNYQVRGKRHARDGGTGQDRTAYLSRHGSQVVCLADGAGSAKKAEFGAQRVVEAGSTFLVEASTYLFDMTDEDVRSIVMTTLLARLEESARRLNCVVKDLASTFLAVVVADGRFLALHIGDGVVGGEYDGRLVVFSGPDNGEYANETVFVTSKRAEESMRIVRGAASALTGFILMSDGTADSLYTQRTNALAPACSQLLRILSDGPGSGKNPEYKKQLRRIMDTVVHDRTDDDCSIAMLARSPIR